MSSSRSEATRAAIVEAARQLLERDGYHAVGMGRVAQEAGISRQAVYLHFESKAKLLEALVGTLNEEYVFPTYARSGIWEAPSGLAALDAWVDIVARTTPPILAVANAVDAARRSDPEAEVIWQGPARGRYQDCLRIVRWLEKDRTLASTWRPEDAARFLWAMTSIRVFEDLAAHGWTGRRFVTHLRRSLRAALT